MFIYTLLFFSKSWEQCTFVQAPILSGNPLSDYVTHNYNTINGIETTPISIQESTPITDIININTLSSFLQNKGLFNSSKADEIQNRMKYSTNFNRAYHTFSSDDIGNNFYNLPKDQKTASNFFNKLIRRQTIVFRGTNKNGNIELNILKIDLSLKKRKSKLVVSPRSDYRPCDKQEYKCEYKTVQEYKCGYKTENSYECGYNFGSYSCGYRPVQKYTCNYEPTQKYECNWVTTSNTLNWINYQVYRWEFTQNYEENEVADLHNQLEQVVRSKI